MDAGSIPFIAAIVAGAYLLGSIPFGLLIGLCRGIDIRQHGSRNIGATNVGRVLGRPWGLLTLACDVLKGLAPTLLTGWLVIRGQVSQPLLGLWLLVGLAAILGHVFPAYLGFRGGKGVATTIGVGLGIYPYYTLSIIAALAAYAAFRYGTGFVSAGSIALAAAFPLAVGAYIYFDRHLSIGDAWPLLAGAVLIGALIIVRHQANIRRLAGGTENRS